MSQEDIPEMSQRSTMPLTVCEAAETYRLAVEEIVKARERYEAIREEARTPDLMGDRLAAMRKADEAWTEFTRLYNRSVEHPEEFDGADQLHTAETVRWGL
jgi:hypothetical protein